MLFTDPARHFHAAARLPRFSRSASLSSAPSLVLPVPFSRPELFFRPALRQSFRVTHRRAKKRGAVPQPIDYRDKRMVAILVYASRNQKERKRAESRVLDPVRALGQSGTAAVFEQQRKRFLTRCAAAAADI